MYNVQTGAKASDNQIASLALPEGQWRGAKSTVPKPGASRGGAVDGLVGTSVALFATFSKGQATALHLCVFPSPCFIRPLHS